VPIQSTQPVHNTPPKPQQLICQSNQFLHQATPLAGAKLVKNNQSVESVLSQIKRGLLNADDVRRALDDLKR
jgi:hypothetical protein